ncbi:hypothetical protein CEXT_450351 [Caerostris extrusa]|uniref:Uncharacterized protein n=1 Tax=Caerostris extrusa TaxID=172846 RepID=A0AAV4XKU6_CAEEX|nr:hypothetical protein CEXT_450351 [Caerostris extrusa]
MRGGKRRCLLKPEAKRKTELHVTAAFKSLSPALALHLEHLLDASAFYRKHYRFSRPPGKPEGFKNMVNLGFMFWKICIFSYVYLKKKKKKPHQIINFSSFARYIF